MKAKLLSVCTYKVLMPFINLIKCNYNGNSKVFFFLVKLFKMIYFNDYILASRKHNNPANRLNWQEGTCC